MTKQEEAVLVLAKAEANLAVAASDAARFEANRADANAKLDKARATCLQARAALRECGSPKPSGKSHEAGYILTRQLEQDSKSGAIAGPPPAQSGGHAVRAENAFSPNGSVRRKYFWRFKPGFPAQEPGQRAAATKPQILRQAIGFLALVLAYLQYLHFDVQLRILSLPSIIALPVQ